MPEQADTNPDRHPTPDELLDYHVGDTSLEQREWIQEHLTGCSMCVQTVLDLEAFPNLPVPGENERLSSDEISVEWERFRERVESARPHGVGRTFGSISLPWKLAAALFITCLGLSIQTVRLQRRMGDLSRPRGGVELVDLSPVDGKMERAEEETKGLHPLLWADRLVLILNLVEARSFPEYETEIVAADGHEVWRGGIRQTPDGTFALEVPRRFLSSGSYHIRLFGLGPQGRIPVAEYSLVLRE